MLLYSTYPTEYYEVASEYNYHGVIPYSSGGRTTCFSSDGPFLPVPSHTPFPTSTGSVDPEDRFGLLYTLQDEYNLPPLGPHEVATEFPGQLIDSVFHSCILGIQAAPATQIQAVSFLTETSTAHVSDPISTLPSVSSPNSRSAETASLRSLLQPASRPDAPQSPNPTSTNPSAVTRPVDKSSATLPSSVPAGNPTLNPEQPTEAAPVIQSLPKSVSVPSGHHETGPKSTTGLLQAADSSSVPIASVQQSVSGIAHDTQRQTGSSFQTPAAPVAIITSQGRTYTAGPEFTSGYVLGTQTLVPGGPAITVSGTPISLPTMNVPETSNAPVAIITSGGTTYAAGSPFTSGYIFGTQTLVPGGPAITVSGTKISLPSGSVPQNIGVPAAIVTSGGKTYTAGPQFTSGYVFGTQTLVPGGPPITVSGIQISLPSGPLVPITGNQAQTETTDMGGYIMSGLGGSMLASSSYPVGQNSASAYIFGTQILMPGGLAVTVSGTQVSLAPNGREIVVGTGTQAQTKTTGIGGYIVSSLGGSVLLTSSGLNPSQSTAQTSTGSTTSRGRDTASTSGGSATANGGRTTLASNLPSTTGAASYTRQVGLKALQLSAALWCLWASDVV
jgi:hypothetical protein